MKKRILATALGAGLLLTGCSDSDETSLIDGFREMTYYGGYEAPDYSSLSGDELVILVCEEADLLLYQYAVDIYGNFSTDYLTADLYLLSEYGDSVLNYLAYPPSDNASFQDKRYWVEMAVNKCERRGANMVNSRERLDYIYRG